MAAERGGAESFRFPASRRIRRAREIRELHKRGERRRTTHLDVFFAASPASRSRVGVVVPKHGSRIVDRNRLRRRLREIARTVLLPGLEREGREVDLLVRARKEAYGATFAELRGQLTQLLEVEWCEES